MNKSKIIDYVDQVLGFDDCRVTDLEMGQELDTMREWLAAGRHASMDYLKRHLPFKEDPQQLLPGARSAIVVIKSYKNTTAKKLKERNKIARYAVGQDYHQVMGKKLQQLSDRICQSDNNVRCYWGVDSRPIAERTLAVKAGLGFIGKNSMLIKPGSGSYFFIGVLLTTLELAMDPPIQWNCGQCRLCLDACPTEALKTPYQLDARHCISYQTIEQKTPMTKEQTKQADGWLFGCDICQEVCPYNHDGLPLTDWPAFHPEQGVGFQVFKNNKPPRITRHTALYRSRKQVMTNWQSRQNCSDFQ